MPLSARLLLAATALCCFVSLLALPLDGSVTGHRCRCLYTMSAQIRSQHFKRIEILPPRANCRNTEILITMKDNKVVCVSPEANWVKEIITKVVQKRRSVKPPVPTSES